MRLDPFLGNFPSLKLERPPELWEARCDEKSLLALVRSMISSTSADTLNASNVVVEPAAAGGSLPVGEFVALTTSGPDGREPDGTWPGKSKLLARLEPALVAAAVRYAYVRSIHGKGSITIFLERR